LQAIDVKTLWVSSGVAPHHHAEAAELESQCVLAAGETHFQ